MNQIPMTLRGVEKLKQELIYLKKVRRPEIIQSISEARKYGDLKENSEYHVAREQQSFCEGRIQEIENKLFNAQIIDITKFKLHDKVIFGATVSIKNIESKEQKTYCIVGDDEADYKKNLISINAPIARGLIGKKTGDIVSVITPNGKIQYEILKINYI